MWTIPEALSWLAAALLVCILSVPLRKLKAKRDAEKEMANLIRRENR